MPKNILIGSVIHEEMYRPVETKVVGESDTKDRVIAEACLQEAEEENRNGRSYLTEDLTREQQCKRTKELIAAGYMLGEAGHPTDTSIIRQQTIAPDNTAVRYLEFWMNGPKWMAKYQGTYNHLGEAVDKDLRHGYRPAFSMRALGSLENINGRNVVRDLKYITHDFVIYPSHPGAYTTRIVGESANYTYSMQEQLITESAFCKEFEIKEKANIATRKQAIIPIYNEQVMSYIKAESKNVQSVLEQFESFYESVQIDEKKSRVILKTKYDDTFVVNLETHIQNEIMSFCESCSEALRARREHKEWEDLNK